MALPKLEVPTYELELPLSKKKIKFRPFLVKEQKNLMMAMESGDSEAIQQNVRDILEVCILTKGIVIDELPIIDIEYLFINLRAKSVGEMSENKYRCNNQVEGGKECRNIMDVNINLTDIKPEFVEQVNPEVNITDKIIVKLNYPPFSLIKDSLNTENITEMTFGMIAGSIEYVYDGEQFHYAKEIPKQEMLEFVENMSQPQFDKIQHFFSNMPKLFKKVDVACSKCGYIHHLEIEGLQSFFGL